ncbi:GNAT family N-acetyltransferase [Chitinibacter sp. SCUT-21]|uniref:GNAT family N-acetyltransferase n=1 Tax=Chitinibacter sp. SCUT-21 TaxID=2970891 RepID=UPI0035A57CF3
MQIRFAQKHDAAAIAALHVQSWQQTYRGTLSDDYLDHHAAGERLAQWRQRLASPTPQQRVWLLEQDHQLIGFCCAYLNHDARWGSYIDNLHVAQAAQGQGLGSLLLAKAAQAVLDEYMHQGIYLYCNQSNTAGRYFYERRGAQCEGEHEWLAPDGSRVATLRYVWPKASQLLSRQGV